jgi:hypothetical protein
MWTFSLRVALRRTVLAIAPLALIVTVAAPALPQTQAMKDRVTDAVTSSVLDSIRSSSCADFAAMMQKRKSSSSSGSRRGAMLKNDPRERQRFVNAVAGPLVNKMIDCDLLPGRS